MTLTGVTLTGVTLTGITPTGVTLTGREPDLVRRLLGGTLARELLSLFVGDVRSTSLRLPEVLPALTEFTGMPVLNRTTVRAAARQRRAAYEAVIVSS